MNNQTIATPDNSQKTQATGCCGGPAPEGVSACCAQDAAVKSAGGTGCGCHAVASRETPKQTSCCA